MGYTSKQKEYIVNATHRWNIKSGAVRSGKSFVDVTFIVPMRIRERIGKDGLCFIIGVSKETIERNVLQPMRERYTSDVVGTINSRNIAKICGEDVYCLGAEKVSQVAKIQGASAKYIYGDEVAKWNEDVFAMLKSRLEYHDLDPNNGLTITNTAYVSDTQSLLGVQIPLSSVEEWESLEANISFPLMKKPAFGYYRNPFDNDIDCSMTPISIFDSALPIVQKADIQFGRLDWEFESGERAIHVDEAALKGDRLARLNKRLYRGVDIDDSNGELFKEYSPTIRQDDIKAGLEAYKREIEFSVGLAYGDLSDPATVAKTATEIKSAKDRKYNTVNAIQENLKDCMEDLVFALAFYNSMTTSGYKFVCEFKDSIKTDEETERKQDVQDLNLGILRPEEYRAKWMGEDIDTALQNLPKKAEVIE